MKPTTPSLTDSEIQSMAEAAHVDERTILRVLLGLPVRGKAGARALRAIIRHGRAGA